MLKGFRDFILRGNVVDLAVAVVIGAAFGAVVTALVKDLITPLIAAIGGKPDFSGLTVTLNNSKFLYGDFVNAVVSFVLIGAAIYFVVVAPMNAIQARFKKPGAPAAPATKQCPECLSTIPLGARRCAFCTAVLSGDALTGGAGRSG
jgi:large conductance mechanosensitive channel